MTSLYFGEEWLENRLERSGAVSGLWKMARAWSRAWCNRKGLSNRAANRPAPIRSHALTTTTSIVHSKLDYCNFLYYKLRKSQLSHRQQIQNSRARTVVKAAAGRRPPLGAAWAPTGTDQVMSYHSHPMLSPLAQNHWMHPIQAPLYQIQAPLTYLQSSHNDPSYIPS